MVAPRIPAISRCAGRTGRDAQRQSAAALLASEHHCVDLGLYFKNEIELMLRHVGFSDIEVTAFGEDRPPDPWNDVRIAIQARRR
jgi:hypothetical protein